MERLLRWSPTRGRRLFRSWYKLVAAAVEAGLYVTAAPGPASPMAALVLSGLPSDRFLFVGYLPTKENARRATIKEFATIRATLIFLESPRRLGASLSTLADVLGERPVAVARELTKRYEEVTRGSLCELAVKYQNENPPKGEIVVVVGPAADMSLDLTDLDSLLAEALVRMSVRDAAATVASASGAPRRTVYRRALEIARELDSKVDNDKYCLSPWKPDYQDNICANVKENISCRRSGVLVCHYLLARSRLSI